MLKQIKNWDKLNGLTMGHNGSMYIVQNAQQHEVYENQYTFTIHPTQIRGTFTMEENKWSPYKLKLQLIELGVPLSAQNKLSMQTALEPEELKSFNTFCVILKQMLQRMLNKMQEGEEFDISWMR